MIIIVCTPLYDRAVGAQQTTTTVSLRSEDDDDEWIVSRRYVGDKMFGPTTAEERCNK